MFKKTLLIESPTSEEMLTLRSKLAEAGIEMSNEAQVSLWFSFDVDVQKVAQALFALPGRLEMRGKANLSFHRELDEYDIEEMILSNQVLSIWDVQIRPHRFSGWQWALVLDYFDESGAEHQGVLRVNKAATCETLIFPDGGYVLRRIETPRSQGCTVLMPVPSV